MARPSHGLDDHEKWCPFFRDFKIHTCSVLKYYFHAEFIDTQIRCILFGGGSKKGLIYTVTILDYLLFIRLISSIYYFFTFLSTYPSPEPAFCPK